jgi:hypothetical protein
MRRRIHVCQMRRRILVQAFIDLSVGIYTPTHLHPET